DDNAANAAAINTQQTGVDTTAPTVSVTSPATGATVNGSVTITANATDIGSGVTSVAFYVDGALLSTDATSPYSASWNTKKVINGTHTIYAVARDLAGHTRQSVSNMVTVHN